MKIPGFNPKVWIINLALLAAVLFVYGGLNWFDSKNPEDAQARPAPKASMMDTVKGWFSSTPKPSANTSADNGEVEYGYAQDGTRLPLDTQDYADSEGLSPDLADNKARLDQLTVEIAQANRDVGEAVMMSHANPDKEDANAMIEEAQNRLYDLQDERESLMTRIRVQETSGDGL